MKDLSINPDAYRLPHIVKAAVDFYSIDEEITLDAEQYFMLMGTTVDSEKLKKVKQK